MAFLRYIEKKTADFMYHLTEENQESSSPRSTQLMFFQHLQCQIRSKCQVLGTVDTKMSPDRSFFQTYAGPSHSIFHSSYFSFIFSINFNVLKSLISIYLPFNVLILPSTMSKYLLIQIQFLFQYLLIHSKNSFCPFYKFVLFFIIYCSCLQLMWFILYL